MRNNVKTIISTILLFVLVAGCFAALPITNAASKPVPGNPDKMDWNPVYADRALTIKPYSYDRGNAAGDKIPSNAHSADYSGIYFYWNNKQADNGVLLVDPAVFSYFEGETFTVTAKTSNCYWGHVLSVDDDEAYDSASDLYIYNIFRNCMYTDKKGNLVKDDMKNINMIFIDGVYKSACFDIEKVWKDEDGIVTTGDNELVSFKEGWQLGRNEVKITDYPTAVNGKKVTITETPIKGFTTEQDLKTLTVRYDDDPIQKVIVTNQKQFAYITIDKLWAYNDVITRVAPDGLTATFDIKDNDGNVLFADAGVGISYKVKEGVYTIIENEIADFDLIAIIGATTFDLDTRTATINVEAGGKYTVTFTNQEIAQPQTARLIIVKSWSINNAVDKEDLEVYHSDTYNLDAEGHFKVNAEPYNYNNYQRGILYLDVDPGNVEILEYALTEGWTLRHVYLNGVEITFTDIDDGFGFVNELVEFLAEAGETYVIEFINNYNVPHANYYVSVVSGADFGYEVKDSADRWADAGWEGFDQYGGTIGDYWHFWLNKYHILGYDKMLEIAGNEAIYGESGIAKDLMWVWGIEDGITICWETQADVQAGVSNPLGTAGEFEYYTGSKNFEIKGTTIDYVSDLYFAADNAAEIFINGKSVKLTTIAIDDIYGDWTNVHDFRIYKVAAADYEGLLEIGANTVSWVARNDNLTAMEWNPCSLMLAFEISSSD